MSKTTAETQAKELLKQETGVSATYAALRKAGYGGYAGVYLTKKKDYQTLTTRADLATTIQFAGFDIILGTTILELVFQCCMHAPKKG